MRHAVAGSTLLVTIAIAAIMRPTLHIISAPNTATAKTPAPAANA